MSRCFPFPPPGYENKARPGDSNLIIKEKHKQEKHKDKKDRDKKERSERKDKERTEGKHKEDKDRKQKKHRDKKDKKKEKRKSSEGTKKTVGPLENQNGEKLGPDNKPGDGAQDCKILVEMGKRVRNDDGATDKKDKKQEKKIVGPSENQNGEKPGPDNKPDDGAHECNFFVKMGKRVRNDDEATNKKDKKKHKSSEEKKIVGPSGNQNGEKPSPGNKPDDRAHADRILVEMGKRVRNEDGAKDNSHASMANGQGLGVDAKCSGNNWVVNFSGEKRIKVENGCCQANMVEKRKEDKEKNGGGLENENRDKNIKEDKKRKKEGKKEKVKEISKEKIKQRAGDGNLLDFCGNKPEDLLKESWDRQGKLPKLKEPALNGFLHDNGTRPDNMSRPAISSHQDQVSKNGNGSHPSQKTTILLAADKPSVITNHKINGKLLSSQSVIKNVRNMKPGQAANNSTAEHPRARNNNHAASNGFISSNPLVENGRKTAIPSNTDKTVDWQRPDFGINGILEGKRDISSRPSPASVKPRQEKDGAFMKKAPHPDLKYLSQILTVPKLDSPQFDDNQDWLFGKKRANKPEMGPSVIECTKRVWANAIRLEYADITVLPYVVPY